MGRVLDFLDQQGLAKDTLVVYTADNGFFCGEYGLFDKRMMYEPSIRVPMLARYPGGLRRRTAWTASTWCSTTTWPTPCSISAASRGPSPCAGHGESWRPVLEGRPAKWRDAWMYEYFEYPAITCTGKMRGIRTDRWKLIHYIQEPQGWELFDLGTDPEERNNLYGNPTYREIASEELKARLERMRTELGDDRSEDAVTHGALHHPHREHPALIAHRRLCYRRSVMDSAGQPKRNSAMDAYRGFVMLLMMAEVLQLSPRRAAFPGNWFWGVLAYNQTHVPWAGCSLHDLIQPSFSFLVGVALPYSIASRIAKGGTFGKMFAHAALAVAAAGRARHLPALHARPADQLHVRGHADADRPGLPVPVPARVSARRAGSGSRSP